MKKLRMTVNIAMTAVLLMRAAAIAIAAYGVYAFYKRQIGEYLFLQTHFVFLDPTEPLIFFFADYLAILGLFVFSDTISLNY